MQCPVCVEERLVLAERQGIEIDYCPHCRGVWLDRGELDKLIERAAAMEPPAPAPTGYNPAPADYSYERPREQYQDRGYDPRRHKKRRGFLGELFDFD